VIDREGALFQERMRRVEALVRDIEESPDVVGRERARELVQSLLELHAVGLAQMMAAAQSHDGPGARLIEAWTRDSAIGGLMLLHGLHPTPAEGRIRDAVDGLDARLRTMSARVARVELSGDVLQLRLEVSASSCNSNAAELRGLVEDALCAAAPDVALQLEVETVEPMPQGFVPLAQLTARRS